MRLIAILLGVSLCWVPNLGAQSAWPPPHGPAPVIQGALVIAGGGSMPDSVYDAFLKLAGGPKARLVIIPTASASADRLDVDKYLESWKKRGAASVSFLHTRSRAKADDP